VIVETKTSESGDRPPPGRKAPPLAAGGGDAHGGPYKGRALGRILIRMGKLDRSQVGQALEVQHRQGGPIGQVLINLGHVNESDVRMALAAQAD